FSKKFAAKDHSVQLVGIIDTLDETPFGLCYTRLNHECTHKTQLTHARINCILKDSSCDTPLSKILKLTILVSNASSSSTKVFKFPYTKNDTIFTHLKFRNQVQCSHSQRRT
ncbi:hypothetical protein H5410_020900, partial [Solanum commersonii]